MVINLVAVVCYVVCKYNSPKFLTGNINFEFVQFRCDIYVIEIEADFHKHFFVFSKSSERFLCILGM